VPEFRASLTAIIFSAEIAFGRPPILGKPQQLVTAKPTLSNVTAPQVKSPSAIKLSLQRDKHKKTAKVTMDLGPV